MTIQKFLEEKYLNFSSSEHHSFKEKIIMNMDDDNIKYTVILDFENDHICIDTDEEKTTIYDSLTEETITLDRVSFCMLNYTLTGYIEEYFS